MNGRNHIVLADNKITEWLCVISSGKMRIHVYLVTKKKKTNLSTNASHKFYVILIFVVAAEQVERATDKSLNGKARSNFGSTKILFSAGRKPVCQTHVGYVSCKCTVYFYLRLSRKHMPSLRSDQEKFSLLFLY